MTPIIPNICRFSSAKQNAIIHKAGINDVNELNNFRTFVNVIIFFRTNVSAIIPIIYIFHKKRKLNYLTTC